MAKDSEGQPPQPTRSLKQFDVLLVNGLWLATTLYCHPLYMGIRLSNG